MLVTPTKTEPEGLENSESKSSYGQILKSTAWIGGSSVINIAISIIRSKVMAILLGPAGFGLAGLYLSVSNLAQSIAGMGINSSGVRQIAEANGSGDMDRVARTGIVLQRVSVVLGLLGATVMLIFAPQISRITFDSEGYAGSVRLLSLAVMFKSVADGQGALLQGLRRISDLAKVNVLGAALGTIATIPLVYFWREDGVAPSLVAVAGTGLWMSWRYSRRIELKKPPVSRAFVQSESTALLQLGFAFMISGLMMLGSAYVARIMVLHKLGLEATGLYQAAWTLAGVYVGFVLQAMGSDFYPRLTASIHDHENANRLVNEQTLVSLLLAGPGILATLIFAPLVIQLFYASDFRGAVEILRWIALGTALQVIGWPIGYIIVAKGAQKLFITVELVWTAMHLGLVWTCIDWFGLDGAGIAFFASYIVHLFLVFPIARKLTGFAWWPESQRILLLYCGFLGATMFGFYLLPFPLAMAAGCVGLAISLIYSVRRLAALIPQGGIPAPAKRILAAIGAV